MLDIASRLVTVASSAAERLGAALAGVTRYQFDARGKPALGPDISSEVVERIRSAYHGQLTQLPGTQSEWYLSDIDDAATALDAGDFSRASRLVRAAKRDAVVRGLQTTKVGGIVKLPKRWRGYVDAVADLSGADGRRPVFDELCPVTEVQALAEDADALGVGVAVLDDVPGRDYPVLTRLDPENLWYHWYQNQWYYRTIAGTLPVHPGDGRWVLHVSGPRVAPWQAGNWHALARAWVRKDHAQASKDNWIMKLANAARVAVAPAGSTEGDRLAHFQNVMAWAYNTVFSLTPGWDVKILESNGRGWEGFDSTEKLRNEDIMIAIVGQVVSVTGGSGFSSSDLYSTVRFDMIEATARPLAATLSTQVLPHFVERRYGLEALADCAAFDFVVQRPGERAAEAAVYGALGSGIKQLDEGLRGHGLQTDVAAELAKFGVASLPMPAEARSVSSKMTVTPSGNEATLRVSEVRANQGVPPLGDERDDLLLPELAALIAARATSTPTAPAEEVP